MNNNTRKLEEKMNAFYGVSFRDDSTTCDAPCY